jgi:hypothetical protein
LLHCFHPLEALGENAVGASGDVEGGNPSVDSDGNGVTDATTALGLMEFGGDTGQ